MNKLQKAVIKQLGAPELDQECIDTLTDVVEQGADAGFSDFIYRSQTVKFFDDNRTLILKAVSDMADDLGESPFDMVRGFVWLQGECDAEVGQVLMGLPCDDDTQVKNALTWFALEEVARSLVDC